MNFFENLFIALVVGFFGSIVIIAKYFDENNETGKNTLEFSSGKINQKRREKRTSKALEKISLVENQHFWYDLSS